MNGFVKIEIPNQFPVITQLRTFFDKLLIDEDTWPRDNLNVIPNIEGEDYDEIYDRAKLFWKKFIPEFEKKFPEIKMC